MPNYARDSKPRALFHLTWTPWIKKSNGVWAKGPIRIAIKNPYFLLSQPPVQKQSKVITYFPYHTVPGEIVDGLDDRRTINLLHKIVSGGKKVRVCIHWHDWSTDRHKFFSRHFETITAGDSLSSFFMTNILEIIQESSEIISENVGSQVLYALALDKKISFIKSDISSSTSLISRHKSKLNNNSLIDRIQSVQASGDNYAKKEILAEFLGFDFKWSRTKILLVSWVSLLIIGPQWVAWKAYRGIKARIKLV